jgi:UDP-glucose 4-epimerase
LTSSGRPVVLVTGASGFVGGHLSPVLTRDGWSVGCAIRHAPSSDDDVVIASIGAESDWSAALAGAEAVVHLAARVHHPHEENAADLYRLINSEGTLRLARCAAQAGVRHFIFVSTVLVHGRSNDGRAPFSEKDVLTPACTVCRRPPPKRA